MLKYFAALAVVVGMAAGTAHCGGHSRPIDHGSRLAPPAAVAV
jgi:hypothetical protein